MTDGRILTCEEALRFLAAYLDGELDDATDLKNHLSRCRTCFSRAEFEKRLKQHVAALGRGEVRPEFAERISKLLSGFSLSAGAPE